MQSDGKLKAGPRNNRQTDLFRAAGSQQIPKRTQSPTQRDNAPKSKIQKSRSVSHHPSKPAIHSDAGPDKQVNNMIFHETSRLLFRSHEPQDEADFIKMHTDPEVRRYAGGSAWPLQKAQARFQNQYLGRPSETYGLWATILKNETKYIGACGLSRAGNAEVASLGYYIARPYWGRGLASEASQAFIEIAFNRLHLPRIMADVEKGNAASERILQKFGFEYVRQEVLPANGRVICFYELSASESERKNNSEPSP